MSTLHITGIQWSSHNKGVVLPLRGPRNYARCDQGIDVTRTLTSHRILLAASMQVKPWCDKGIDNAFLCRSGKKAANLINVVIVSDICFSMSRCLSMQTLRHWTQSEAVIVAIPTRITLLFTIASADLGTIGRYCVLSSFMNIEFRAIQTFTSSKQSSICLTAAINTEWFKSKWAYTLMGLSVCL